MSIDKSKATDATNEHLGSPRSKVRFSDVIVLVNDGVGLVN